MASILPDLGEKYARWLRIKLRASGAPDAEDLSHETFMKLMGNRRREDVRNPRALLATIARRIAIDGGRRLRARGGPAAALDALPDHALPWVSPDQESALLLKQVIFGLPQIYRDTFVLNRFIGLTYAEIAERQGISVKAVEYRMSRAIALCAQALRD